VIVVRDVTVERGMVLVVVVRVMTVDVLKLVDIEAGMVLDVLVVTTVVIVRGLVVLLVEVLVV
jgi:hypothetical protein